MFKISSVNIGFIIEKCFKIIHINSIKLRIQGLEWLEMVDDEESVAVSGAHHRVAMEIKDQQLR